jgi:hypothetical protein
MYNKNYVKNKFNYLKELALKYSINGNYNKALDVISFAAHFAYTFNHVYYDNDLESILCSISMKVIKEKDINISVDKSRLCFYDGFGNGTSGLSMQYLNAIKELDKEIIYIFGNYNHKKSALLVKILEESQNIKIMIMPDNISNVERINRLYNDVNEFKPSSALLMMTPWDTVGVSAFMSLDSITRYNINLTDHAFWLGVGCLDYSLEFRPYGKTVSIEKRNINKDKILCHPFYPIDFNIKFHGFPSTVKDDKTLIFSGGAYYKIYGDNYKYFDLLLEILNQNRNIQILYAGWGDDRPFRSFIKKNRLENCIILLGKRSDYNEVIKKCDIYLGTYPLPGGLMSQYAALHSKPIVSLLPVDRKGNGVTDFISHNYTEGGLNVDFTEKDDLLNEINSLIKDIEYRKERGKILNKSLFNERQFVINIQNILLNNKSAITYDCINIKYDDITIDCIQTENNYNSNLMLHAIKLLGFRSLLIFPFRTIVAILKYTKNKIKQFVL